MTVSIKVTSQKDPVYKPPPPTVATPAATTATAAAILTFPTTQTPFHFVIKDLLQKQRLVLSWSSLRWVISRGIYPSSTFLTTPGSTTLPDIFSTKALLRPPSKKNPTLDSLPSTKQTETSVNSPTTPNICPSARPASQDILQTAIPHQHKGMNTKTDPLANSTDNDTLATPIPLSLESATPPSATVMVTIAQQQQESNLMAIDVKPSLPESLQQQQPLETATTRPGMDVDTQLSTATTPSSSDQLQLVTTMEAGHRQQENDVVMMETDDVIDQDAGKDAVTLLSDDQPHSQQIPPAPTSFATPVSTTESTHKALPDISPSSLPIDSVPSSISVSTYATSPTDSTSSANSMSMISPPPVAPMESTSCKAPTEPTHTATSDTSNSSASLSMGSILSNTIASIEPISSAAPDPMESEPETPVSMDPALPKVSETMKPTSPAVPAPPTSISPSTSVVPVPMESIDSKTPLPRPVTNTSSSARTTPPSIDSTALLPRPRSKTPSSNGSTTLPVNARRSSPISSKTPLPRPSTMAPVGSSSIGNTTSSLRNSNPPIPPRRNSKLPIRASSSTPLGSLSSKRPATSPAVNKRRAIPSLFSPTDPTAVPTTIAPPPSPPPLPSKETIRTNKTVVRPAPGSTAAKRPASTTLTARGHRKPMLTKMDHMIPQDHSGDDDDEEEERPKPISRKEKLSRQAKRAEQIKFYRVREEREAREQRLAARRRLIGTPSTKYHGGEDELSDSGSSNISSTSATSSSATPATVSMAKQRNIRTKGVKFNLNRNRVIEIRGGNGDTSLDDQPAVRGSSSRIPHSIR